MQLCMMSLPILLPGPMFLSEGVSVSGSISLPGGSTFLLGGISVQEVSLTETPSGQRPP